MTHLLIIALARSAGLPITPRPEDCCDGAPGGYTQAPTDGEPCPPPVPADTPVLVIFRDGFATTRPQRADFYTWGNWSHPGMHIVAYRVVRPQAPSSPTTKDRHMKTPITIDPADSARAQQALAAQVQQARDTLAQAEKTAMPWDTTVLRVPDHPAEDRREHVSYRNLATTGDTLVELRFLAEPSGDAVPGSVCIRLEPLVEGAYIWAPLVAASPEDAFRLLDSLLVAAGYALLGKSFAYGADDVQKDPPQATPKEVTAEDVSRQVRAQNPGVFIDCGAILNRLSDGYHMGGSVSVADTVEYLQGYCGMSPSVVLGTLSKVSGWEESR